MNEIKERNRKRNAERRLAEKKTLRSARRICALVLILLFFVSLLAASWMLRATEITVEGTVHADPEAVGNAVFKTEDDTRLLRMALTDLTGGYRCGAFTARLRLHFPEFDSVTIRVTEREPAAALGVSDGYLLISDRGVVIGRTDTVSKSIGVIDGIDIQSWTDFELPVTAGNEVTDALKIMEGIRKTETPGDPLFVRDGMFYLNEGEKVSVCLGTGDHLEEKLELLNSLLPGIGDLTGVLHLEGCDGDTAEEKYYFTVGEPVN